MVPVPVGADITLQVASPVALVMTTLGAVLDPVAEFAFLNVVVPPVWSAL